MSHRTSFRRVVRAEWGKFWALRSTWVVFAVVGVAAVGLAAAIGAAAQEHRPAQAFLAVDVFSIVLGVFGMLMVTGEYGSGLIRATFAAVPRRLPVLWAKAVVLAAAATPLMLVVCAASLLADWVCTPAADRFALGTDGLVRATAGAALAPVALALLGLGIGALLRHTAAAITVYVLSMLVLPAILGAVLPAGRADDVVRYVPVAAAQALYALPGGGSARILPPGSAALVLLAWVVVALAAGGVALRRRDP
ncbi:ABC transporter permease [Dactylosporangium vinaceum]|uniref:ABC transporter permease subunit n=1 Tax=Dactylosporangium vinaceum TaxID=53362 RepID=A0ABV5M911_9ACTN|nr:ABC transporter permease subunit [Dactylosporangium vinaceum]UAB99491.1 ABC transporter permease [Dactylosporangium vinaceum]